MKKAKTVGLTLAGIFMMTVAAVSFAAATNYTATIEGHNAPLTVQVSIDGTKITDVKVTRHAETSAIGTVAIERVPAAVVKNQSVAVDTVSGATITSMAILAGIRDCLRQAGLDPAKYAVKPVKVKGKDETVTYDFVIIGAGGAGMTAALRADQLGVKTLLLEKMDMPGGAFSVHGGAMVLQGSQLQKSLGVTEDSPNAMVHDFLANGHFKNDLPKLALYANKLGSTVDWLVDYVGVKYNTKKGFRRLGEYTYDRVVYGYEGGTGGLMETYKEALERAKNETLLTATRANSLIHKNGEVLGVEATRKDGSRLTVHAKAVLLATGGYGNNKDMLVEPAKSALYYGPICATGDGHKMAMELGAKMVNMELAKVYPNGIEWRPGSARSTSTANDGATKRSGILVNIEGNRIVNERAPHTVVKAALFKDPLHKFFFVMDENSYQGWIGGVNQRLIPPSDIAKWLADDGKHVPTFVKGNTLEEVAAKAGIKSPENLRKTVERYNSFVEQGLDEDFGRPKEFMKQKIDMMGPFYIIEQKPRFATTLGGVDATQELEAITTDNKVIRNLFVAGEVVDMVQGDDSPVGANVGWAVTSGKYVAEIVAERLKAEKH